jgi:hypothetical protein
LNFSYGRCPNTSKQATTSKEASINGSSDTELTSFIAQLLMHTPNILDFVFLVLMGEFLIWFTLSDVFYRRKAMKR